MKATPSAKAALNGQTANRGAGAKAYSSPRTFRINFFRGDVLVAFLTESTDCGKAKLRAVAVKYIAQGFAERSEEDGPGAIRAGKEKKKNS
jgi:hypothetical protein